MSDIITVHPNVNARQFNAARAAQRLLGDAARPTLSAPGVQSFVTDHEHGPCAERVTVCGQHRHRGRLVWCTPNGAVSLVLMVGYWGPGRLRMIPSHRTRLGW